MLTGSAQRAVNFGVGPSGRLRSVASVAELSRAGVTRSVLVANLDARRWRRHGRAIVLHAGPVTAHQRLGVALINCGPRSALAAFTAAEALGLRSWERSEVHVVVPTGAKPPTECGVPIRLHRTTQWPVALHSGSRCHRLAPALIVAAAEFGSPRPACGMLAAAVQQRLVLPEVLIAALEGTSQARYRKALLSALKDIAGGSQALSEIDFAQLCRRGKLPIPNRQTVRTDSAGRRRYLDASWRRSDGRLVLVEVDGALYLSPRSWWDDQLRQNELVLGDALVLRFPSIVVRTEPETVLRQLRLALIPTERIDPHTL